MTLFQSLRPLKRWIIRRTRRPRPGSVDFGDLRRWDPISRDWGFDRGTPVDRFYIESFLGAWDKFITGHVLEIADNAYTRRFGGDRVIRSDVLHPFSGNPRATLVADLGTGEGIVSDRFDCIICTQTLQFIFPVQKAVESLHQLLKPGGVLLATVPGISQISREDMELTGDFWRFTTESITRLITPVFGQADAVEAYGNVYAATAFLHGVAAEELDSTALNYRDSQFQVVIAAVARKSV